MDSSSFSLSQLRFTEVPNMQGEVATVIQKFIGKIWTDGAKIVGGGEIGSAFRERRFMQS